jgi:hypothetical protein
VPSSRLESAPDRSGRAALQCVPGRALQPRAAPARAPGPPHARPAAAERTCAERASTRNP